MLGFLHGHAVYMVDLLADLIVLKPVRATGEVRIIGTIVRANGKACRVHGRWEVR